MPAFIDLTGQRFGRWFVVERTNEKRGTSWLWVCRCDCGKVRKLNSTYVKRTKSCGCYRDELSRGRFVAHKITDDFVEVKRCSRCRLWLPLDFFNEDRHSWDKLDGTCRGCVAKRRVNRRDKDREYDNNRRKVDLNYRIEKVLRSRMSHALKRNKKADTTRNLVGCSVDFLKRYLESMFAPDMSWDNHGKVWHIDHIRPCASFDLSKENEQRNCFHYTNLQPLYSLDNMKKGARYENSYGSQMFK